MAVAKMSRSWLALLLAAIVLGSASARLLEGDLQAAVVPVKDEDPTVAFPENVQGTELESPGHLTEHEVIY